MTVARYWRASAWSPARRSSVSGQHPGQRLNELVRPGGGAQDDVAEQLLLVGEVLVDGLLGHRGQGRNLIHARALVPLVQEQPGGRLHDRPALARGPASRLVVFPGRPRPQRRCIAHPGLLRLASPE